MLSKLTTNQKVLLIVSAIILFFGVLITTIVILILNFKPVEETVTEPPLKIEYCGARLEQICILSFSRNDGGDSLINLFVPNDFPDFYLNVKRLTKESTYECERDENQETNATCVGEALNLGEQIEITMISKDGEIPFAVGKFVLTAIFISSEAENINPPLSRTAIPATATRPVVTPETESPTPTPEVSYPSYP